MATCPNCQSEGQSGDSYCRECGYDLSKIPDPGRDQDFNFEADPSSKTSSGSNQVNNSASGRSSSEITTKRVTKEESVSAASVDAHELKSRLQAMDEYEFEHLVADLWSEMGWDTTVSQASVDAGLDVVAEKYTPYHQKKVIQAKRYGDSTTVGGPDIQQYASLREQVDDADSVIVATTSSFTSSGKSRASDLNVKLVDGDDLVSMIDDLDAYDAVDEYLNFTRTVTEEVPVEPDPDSAGVADSSDTASEDSEDQYERGWFDPSDTSTEGSQQKDEERGRVGGSVADEPSAFLGFTHWNWVAAVTGVLAFFAVPISAELFLALLVATALAMVFDMRYVVPQTTWQPSMLLYLGGLLVVFASLPLYLVNRYRYFSRHAGS